MSSTTISSARPATRLLSSLLKQTPAHHGLVAVRSHQLAARTKRALRIRPHPSHLLRSAPGPDATDEIVFNPPASQPTVYNTPFKFLPRTDPRRGSNLQALFNGGQSFAKTGMPPTVGHAEEKRYHITQEQMKEMRELRMGNPDKWTCRKLAKRFDCSKVFVERATTVPKDYAQQIVEDFERRRARWGPKRLKAKEERKQRKEMLFRGEI